jgi:hypothetical protein
MKRYLLPIELIVMGCTETRRDCAKPKAGESAGDAAALAPMQSISVNEMDSTEQARQILLILNLAFAAPELSENKSDQRPTAAMLLLEHLSKTKYDREHVNEIENTRNGIEHNTSTGHPYQVITLKGAPPLDVEHTWWVPNVLRWTGDIKPGMTRKDLLRVFTTEGGISTDAQQTFALKGCPYVHVDVEFSPVLNDHVFSGHPSDKIIKISKPYLDALQMD